MNAYEILGVSPSATQEEIAKAYKRLALKYHPDRNRGNEEWAKKKFIEVGEAYKALSESAPKRNFGFSNKPGSDKFKEFEEMFNELKADFREMREGFKKDRENLDKVQEELRKETIQNTEERMTLANVSAYDLDSSLWTPYRDWKEKIGNLVNEELTLFQSQMTVAIEEAKWKKINNSNNNQFGQGDYSYNSHSWQNPQQPRGGYGSYGNPQSNFGGKNFPPKNSGWTGENKPFSTEGSKIQQLEAEIEYNRNYMFSTPHEDEKQKCQKIIDRLEKELKGSSNSNKNERGTSNSNFRSPSNNNSDGQKPNNYNSSEQREKDEKINQLEKEIEELKKSNSWNPKKQKENERKLVEKEQKLSELKKSNEDDTNNLNQEELINELINEIERLKKENKKDELTKKIGGLEKVIQQLVKEIQELRNEVKELKEQKEKGTLSEYQTYYLNRQESQLKDREQKLEKLRGVVNNSNSNSNSNSNDFPVGWVVGSGIGMVALLIIAVLIVRRKRKNRIKK